MYGSINKEWGICKSKRILQYEFRTSLALNWINPNDMKKKTMNTTSNKRIESSYLSPFSIYSWSTHASKKVKMATKYMTDKYLQESVSLSLSLDTKLDHLPDKTKVKIFWCGLYLWAGVETQAQNFTLPHMCRSLVWAVTIFFLRNLILFRLKQEFLYHSVQKKFNA